jgi:small subunit ribosomal protein S4
VLENTTVEGESPVVENTYPALDSVPKYRGYTLRPGDVVELAEGNKSHLRCKAALEAAESRGFPEWLEVDVKAGKGTFKAFPQRAELPATLNEGLVVELYSR